jgi:dihydrofolate reductase
MADARWGGSSTRPAGDPSGGFEHGGWHMPYADEVFQEWVLDNLNEAAGIVLGRKTYEGFAGYWSNVTEEEQPIAGPLNTLPKYVATRTLDPPLEWENSIILPGDAHGAIAEMKQDDGGPLHVIGSTDLVRQLVSNDLVDEFRFIIDPLIVGGGKGVFPEDGENRPLKLEGSRVTTTGAHIVSLSRARDHEGMDR